MKLISIVVPTFNEEENVVPLAEKIISVFKTELLKYQYEILFIDNNSEDKTREKIKGLCHSNPNIKAIFNVKNFGQFNSPYYGLLQTMGDAAILIAADFQDPVEMIPVFVDKWENGHKIVCGIKTNSEENRFIYLLRSLYYKLISSMSEIEQIEHFTGFGLYDRSFIATLRSIKDPTPFLRGIVAEFGSDICKVPYHQLKRNAGNSSNNLYSLYDAAMLSFTSYTKIGLRLATIVGFFFSVLSLTIAFAYLILKLLFWNRFLAGVTPILLGVFLFGSIQVFFIGLLGEYIMNINVRIINRPLVIEKYRINFD